MILDMLQTILEEILEYGGISYEKFKEDCDHIYDWIQTQPHLPHDIDRNRLQRMVLNRKFSLEVAKKKIDAYYTIRNLVPELYADMDPLGPSIQNAMEIYHIVPMPKLTKDHSRVLYFGFLNDNVDRYIAWDIYKYGFMIGELRISYDFCNGDILVVDMKKQKIGHLAKLTPAILTKTYVVMTKAYGQKINQIHLINTDAYVDKFLQMIKPFYKPKVFARIHAHRGTDTLADYLPLECIPKDYGGTSISIQEGHAMWNEALIKNRDFFLNEMKIKTDESKRPEKLNDDLFGSMHGSFRKLNVD